MTVETFCFCADLSLVKRWWEQPIKKTIIDLTDLKIEKFPEYWGLIDDGIVQGVLIFQLNSLKSNYEDFVSLSQICKRTIEVAASPIQTRWLSIFPWKRRKIMEIRFGEIARLGDLHTGLILASRRGPVNEPLETRVVDHYFSTWLEQFISQSEAHLYDGSTVKNSQYHYPPEYKLLKIEFLRDLEMYVPIPYLINAGEWKRKIEKLNKLAGVWDSLENDVNIFSKILNQPNLKSYNHYTPIYNEIVKKYLIELNFSVPKDAKDEFLMLGTNRPVSNERVVKHLQEIAKISQYAIDNSLQLMKIMYM